MEINVVYQKLNLHEYLIFMIKIICMLSFKINFIIYLYNFTRFYKYK
jgi:hypothetical protein